METIEPIFKSEDEKNLLVLIIVAGLFFGFIPFIIAYFALKDEVGDFGKQIITALLNFELVLFLVALICGVIPFIGWLLGIIVCPLTFIVHIIVLIRVLISIANKKPVEIPVPVKLFS